MKIIMLEMPTHPRANPENFCPARILPAAMAISNIPQPADTICLELAWLKSGVRRRRISSKAKMTRLRQQLPKRVPTARSGSLTKAAALTPVASSGMEVMAARSISPIHIRLRLVFSAIASPYRASFVPANKIMARHRMNLNQTNQTTDYAPNGQSYYIESKPIKHIANTSIWYNYCLTRER
jgi:hypothetical protein